VKQKRYLLAFLKFTIPVVILGWLFTNVDRQQLQQLWQQQIDWPLLSAGFALVMLAVCVSFARWYLLVRALQLPFTLRDAFRLSFVAYLLNFVGVGAVGGDLFKAFFIAREQPGRRPEAVATVVIDRVIGLFALLLLTSSAILISGVADAAPVVRAICNVTLVGTGVAVAMVTLVLIPRFSHGRFIRLLTQIPKIGPIIGRLLIAVGIYRSRMDILAVAGLMSLGIHVLLALSLYLVAISIFQQHPTLAEHFIIVPLSLVAGALPLTPAGLGTFEMAMSELYKLLPAQPGGDGFIVALAYRMLTIVVAVIGVFYYWFSRREMGELIEQAEEETEAIEAGRRGGHQSALAPETAASE
jgi:uncharacterized protein (TIRG00374 family)